MKKIFIFSICVIACIATMVSCDQVITRKYGGTTTIKLEPGEKLIEATWKEGGNLWYLVEPMDSNYTPKTKVFKESSTMGVLEGKVVFEERR
jgi:hypothetical protein